MCGDLSFVLFVVTLKKIAIAGRCSVAKRKKALSGFPDRAFFYETTIRRIEKSD